MDSASSSNSSSTAVIIFSSLPRTSWLKWKRASTFSSRSNSLTANQRRCPSSVTSRIRSVIWLSAFSISSENSCFAGLAPEAAAFLAASISSLVPLPLSAVVSTTGTPSSAESFFTSIVSPRLLTMSIILSATTTGMPISSSCVVKYKLRSMLDASTKFTITSGFSFTRKSRVMTSSSVYGDSE